MVERQRGARQPVDDPGRADPARRLARHRRNFAAACPAPGQDRHSERRHRARSCRRSRIGAFCGTLCRPARLVPAWQLCNLRLAAGDAGPDHAMASENTSIGRLAVGAVLVIPFIVTDFRVLMPDIPVRLGALGALLVVTAILIAERGAETQRQALLMTALRLSSSALLGIAAAFVAPDVDAAQVMRFCAIAIAGVLTIGLMVDALRAYFESQVPGVLNSVAASPAKTRDALIAELARHPIFESARRYRESELLAYDPALLRDFLSSVRVLRRPDAPQWTTTVGTLIVARIDGRRSPGSSRGPPPRRRGWPHCAPSGRTSRAFRGHRRRSGSSRSPAPRRCPRGVRTR